MYIDNIRFQHFRNLTDITLECHPTINVLWGNNGQGKSNLLEGISCLSYGKSFRVSSEKPLIQFTKPVFYLNGRGVKSSGNFKVEMAYDGQKKKVKVNGVEKKRLLDFIGNLLTVSFSPDDLALVKGGKSERRRFLDTMLCQVNNRYALSLTTYSKILEQRNRLLRDRPAYVRETLATWDIQFSQQASELWVERQKAVLRLETLSNDFFKRISGDGYFLGVEFQPAMGDEYLDLYEPWDKDELARKLLGVLTENRGLELARGHSLFGPHRDDLPILLNDMDVRSFASQGQQRLIALSLKMGELHFIEEVAEDSPILLLDDIFSELDETKVTNLLDFLQEKKRQVFITTTERLTLPFEHGSFNVSSGIVRKDLANT